MDVTVRQASYDDARELEKYYYFAYGKRARYKYPERWNWLFRDNPWSKKDKPDIFVAESVDGEIVGHVASFSVPCKVLERSTVLGWGCDAKVSPSLRGQGVGKKLYERRQDCSLFGSFNSAKISTKIKLSLGAIVGPSARFFVYFNKFTHKYTLESLRSRSLETIPRSLLNCLLFLRYYRLISKLHCTPNRSDVAIESRIGDPKPADFGDRDTKLWTTVRNKYDFAIERNADYLNWRYREEPWGKHYCCRAYDNTDNVIGISIFRISERQSIRCGVLLELYAVDGNADLLNALLIKSMHFLAKQRVHQIHIASSERVLAEVVKSTGFWEVNQFPVLLSGDESIIMNINSESSAMLSLGDHDWDRPPEFYLSIDPLDFVRKLSRER
ncbi:MAG: GNAT family N-acetyltransferase [Acidobacteria bacterium]|nr:GNAT family N-acetyltransferase [Acidobacteriota bacterium]